MLSHVSTSLLHDLEVVVDVVMVQRLEMWLCYGRLEVVVDVIMVREVRGCSGCNYGMGS